MSPCGSTPVRPIKGRPSCSLLPYPPPHRLALRLAFPDGETTGLPRSATVTVWVRSRLSAGGTTAAPEEFGTSGPGHVPFGPSVSASCRLAFVTTFNSASPELTNTTPSWFPTPLMLGVAALASRPWLPFAEGGYVVARASYPTVTRDARPARILRASTAGHVTPKGA
jgi:hypothetical protein